MCCINKHHNDMKYVALMPTRLEIIKIQNRYNHWLIVFHYLKVPSYCMAQDIRVFHNDGSANDSCLENHDDSRATNKQRSSFAPSNLAACGCQKTRWKNKPRLLKTCSARRAKLHSKRNKIAMHLPETKPYQVVTPIIIYAKCVNVKHTNSKWLKTEDLTTEPACGLYWCTSMLHCTRVE